MKSSQRLACGSILSLVATISAFALTGGAGIAAESVHDLRGGDYWTCHDMWTLADLECNKMRNENGQIVILPNCPSNQTYLAAAWGITEWEDRIPQSDTNTNPCGDGCPKHMFLIACTPGGGV